MAPFSPQNVGFSRDRVPLHLVVLSASVGSHYNDIEDRATILYLYVQPRTNCVLEAFKRKESPIAQNQTPRHCDDDLFLPSLVSKTGPLILPPVRPVSKGTINQSDCYPLPSTFPSLTDKRFQSCIVLHYSTQALSGNHVSNSSSASSFRSNGH